MTELEILAAEIDRAFHCGTWVDVPLGGVFTSLPAEAAAAHPIPGAHSAWEILLHLMVWHDAVRRRLLGETVDYSDDADWPEIPEPTEANWRAARERAGEARRALVDVVRGLAPEALEREVVGKQIPVREMLWGVVQHDHYHAGQAVMLRKAWNAPSRQQQG